MTRYFLFLAYNGADFHGWQVQPNAVTVQGVLEDALQCLLREPVRLTGAGRTDTGVHAAGFVAHFDTENNALDGDADWLRHLNGILPRSIVVHAVRRVRPDAHARFDALARTYRYAIMRVPCPFALTGWYHDYRPLQVEAMQEACLALKEYTDFTSFSKLHTDVKTNNCRIDEARLLAGDWAQTAPMLSGGLFVAERPDIPVVSYPTLIFEITADRFLRNMVRAITGTLLDVGLGHCTPDGFRRIIEARNRCAAGTSVPADGLYLTGIRYGCC